MKVLKDLGLSLGLLEAEVQKSRAFEVDESEAIGILTKDLVDELNDLTKQYGRNSPTWDQAERERHQKRVAAKACNLLVTGEHVLKPLVKGFDMLKRFFCQVAGQPTP